MALFAVLLWFVVLLPPKQLLISFSLVDCTSCDWFIMCRISFSSRLCGIPPPIFEFFIRLAVFIAVFVFYDAAF